MAVKNVPNIHVILIIIVRHGIVVNVNITNGRIKMANLKEVITEVESLHEIIKEIIMHHQQSHKKYIFSEEINKFNKIIKDLKEIRQDLLPVHQFEI